MVELTRLEEQILAALVGRFRMTTELEFDRFAERWLTGWVRDRRQGWTELRSPGNPSAEGAVFFAVVEQAGRWLASERAAAYGTGPENQPSLSPADLLAVEQWILRRTGGSTPFCEANP